ncbi:MAG: TIGR02679 family protein [Bacillota bacterium]
MMDQELRAAAEFFRREQGFKRLFEMFIQNYQSLGRVGGTARLNKLTQAEKVALGGFFGVDYSKKTTLTISTKQFTKGLERTRYADLDLKELLFYYQGSRILTKAEQKEEYLTAKEQFFNELLKAYPNEYCQLWLEQLQKNRAGGRGVYPAYRENPLLLRKQLQDVLEAICKLPAKANNNPTSYYRLPVFAHRVTEDPHAFDSDTPRGRFLLNALSFIRTVEDQEFQQISNPNAEEVTELLSYFGLIRDDILNFVTLIGIIPREKDLAGPFKWWAKSAEAGAVLNVPLREIIKVNSFTPFNGRQQIYVVENSGVFSEILDRLGVNYQPPLICTNGQFKLAALLFFDRLVKNGVNIYYSGDFDPEGLLMAERLKNRYPSSVKLWHYALEDYRQSISQVNLTENRLNKLNKLRDQELEEVKELMLKIKKAGYQEQLIEYIVEDIKAACS